MDNLYPILLPVHSVLRYFVIAALALVILKSLMGWLGNKPFEKSDDKLSLFMMIGAHLQLLIGLVLYFISPWVRFGGDAMKDPITRYWNVEHITMMIIAIVFITIARSSSKKLTVPSAKHKRLFIFTTVALVIIIAAIVMSKRGLLSMTSV
ncbi:MAG: cytochrome B [Cytophagaceae bacterium]|nr:cytochrome B [Cytophagaceae bacterium]